MTNRWASWSALTIAVFAFVVAAWASTVHAADGEPFAYYYFKEEKALHLDTSQIAVFELDPSPTGGSESFLYAAGFKDSSVRKTQLPGWSLFHVGVASGSPTLAPSLAASASAQVFDTHPTRLISHLVGLDVNGRFFFSPVFESRSGPVIPTPTILVRFQEHSSAAEVAGVLSDLEMGHLRRERFGGVDFGYKIDTGARSGFAVLPLANRLARHPSVIAAEPDMLFSGRSAGLPNDPQFLQSWGLYNYGQWGGPSDLDVDATEAWNRSFGDGQIRVLVIDTGVQPDHPDLHVLPTGVDTTSEAGFGEPKNVCDNHGTPVAGIVASVIDNGIGTAGVAPETWVVSARAFISNVPCFDVNGKPTGWVSFSSWTVDALEWARSQGVSVTNNSNDYGDGFYSSIIAQKYQETKEAGMVHFASAGNDEVSNAWFPASLPSVNAVTAIEPRQGGLAWFSNWGSAVDFTAAGDEIFSTDRTGSDGWGGGDYISGIWGTSFSSPLVAGVAALLLSEAPALDAWEVEALLRETSTDLGTPGWDPYFGWGMPNAATVLEALDLFEDDFDSGDLSQWSGVTP